MASNLFVSYDLQEPGKNYNAVISAVKGLGSWAKVHYSLWYVKSDYTAAQAVQHVCKATDANDKVLVVDVTQRDAAWQNLDPDVAKFIQANW